MNIFWSHCVFGLPAGCQTGGGIEILEHTRRKRGREGGTKKGKEKMNGTRKEEKEENNNKKKKKKNEGHREKREERT